MVCSLFGGLAMAAGYILSQLTRVLLATTAFAYEQRFPQAPVGTAVHVTADNFNRAETDMYFGTIVKDHGIGILLTAASYI